MCTVFLFQVQKIPVCALQCYAKHFCKVNFWGILCLCWRDSVSDKVMGRKRGGDDI